ncbi:enoyl-CoA hydratase/isomerase family protein [Affinibrenneria salicis]|uniref:Enoyl-CoA hydratase/isomerase family protein n=1 Tax=Affinibrenneria salicis TaxID=2590031 RepID=A0A5J5G1L7_9GAMM|nr:enoyl-CoA hydratase/isomerase family protein [Affinibrenneria salicis]KAA9000551.1 enoyl-CoA hydratase/isomerase family protein [Affinibrenneria salicis]
MPDVIYSSRNKIATITISNPQKYNIFTHEIVHKLNAAWSRFNNSEDRVAVLTGEGEAAFTAGANLKDIPHDLWRAVPGVGIDVNKPIIAAISGLVVGGGLVLVQMADLAIATEQSTFSYPEAKIGFTGGLIASLAARIPHKIAMELLFIGESISAQRAYEAGLINKVTPQGEHLNTAYAWAEKIAKNSPVVLQTLKDYVGKTIPKGPSEISASYRAQIEHVINSPDFDEGIDAFISKRTPNF